MEMEHTIPPGCEGVNSGAAAVFRSFSMTALGRSIALAQLPIPVRGNHIAIDDSPMAASLKSPCTRRVPHLSEFDVFIVSAVL
jgi:hypothetical protein